MGGDVGKLLELGIRAREIRGGSLQALVGDLARRDITNVANDERLAVFGSHRAQADFQWELRPVPAQAEQLQARAHRSGVGVALVAGAMTDVPSAEALGQQHFNGLAKQLSARIPEQHLGLSVHDLDQTRGVDDDHPVGGRLQQSAELGFRGFFLMMSDGRHANR